MNRNLLAPLLLIAAATALLACDKRIEMAQKAAEAEKPMASDELCKGSCDELSYQCCSDRADCAPIRGTQASSTLGCKVPLSYAGCQPADIMCAQAITHAVGPDGDCWQFPNSCTPQGDGWQQVSADEQQKCEEKLAELEACG